MIGIEFIFNMCSNQKMRRIKPLWFSYMKINQFICFSQQLTEDGLFHYILAKTHGGLPLLQ
jgi:hypothetical protein